MEKTVAALARAERDMLPHRGASFLRSDDGEVLFRFVIDTANIIGPRPATSTDQAQYPGEWAAFLRAEGLSPLDRDARGGPGGSLPPAEAAEPQRARRARRT